MRVTRPACHFNPSLGPEVPSLPTHRETSSSAHSSWSLECQASPCLAQPFVVQQPGIDPALLSEEGQTDCQIQKIDHLIEVVCCAASEVLTSPFSAPTHSLRGGLDFVTRLKIQGAPGSSSDWGSTHCAPTKAPAL
ncbi:Multidrug Resistance-Associated Protein 4 [Manis pentadactyla]|nr:Multidrug Resistance-Associated Protein 4 [Manis pentadactyla]